MPDAEQALREAREEYGRHDLAFKKNKEKKTDERDDADYFERARKKYFEARSAAFAEKEKIYIENDPELKGLSAEELLSKHAEFAGKELASEFKELYDLKTQILAEEKDKTTGSKIGRMIRQGAEWYKKLPLKYKLAYSGILIAGSLSAGPSTALAAFIGGGRVVQRILSTGVTTITVEGLIQKRQDKKFAREFEEHSEYLRETFENNLKTAEKDGVVAGLVEFLKNNDDNIEARFGISEDDLNRRKKIAARWRWGVSLGAGALVGSGLIGKTLGKGLHAFFGTNVEAVGDGHPQGGAPGHDTLIPENKPTGSVSHIPKPSPFPEKHIDIPGSGKIAARDFSKLPDLGTGTPEIQSPEGTSVLDALAEHPIATIEHGGNISKAALQLFREGKMTQEEFRAAWANSTV